MTLNLKHEDLARSAEVDRNRLVIQHNNDQNEVLQLTDRVNELEIRIRDNNNRVEGPRDGHFIVKRAHTEIQTAQNEARIANEELSTARSIFDKKIEQITAEHAVALDQSKTVINSLKSDVHLLTHNAKIDSNVTVNVVPNNTEALPRKALQPSSGPGYQTPFETPVRSLSPSSSQVIKEMFSSFSAQLAALNEKVDRQAERPTRGRSSTKRGHVLHGGPPPMGGDGEPGDFPDEEDDGEYDEDEWDDEEGDDDDNVRTYAASGCERTVVERRTPEQDTVKVPAFPTLPSLTQRRIQISKNLVTASGRLDQREITRWGEIGFAEDNFETLADSDSGERRFLGLDLKLSTALGSMLKQANSPVTQDVNVRENLATNQGTMLKGRQIAWLVLKHFQTNPQVGAMYQITDFADFEWRGDEPTEIHTFMYILENMLSQMHTSLSRHELAGISLQRLEKSNVLKEDLAHYYRQEPGHPDHNYEYLINSMTRYLRRKRYDVNRVGGIQSTYSENMGRGAAPAVDDDAKSKRAKAKKKARDAAKAAKLAAPAGKGKGGGKGNSDKLGVCYFHNTEAGCIKTAKECKFDHKKLSAAEAAKLVKPPGRESRANSPAAKAKAKAKAKAGPKVQPRSPSYCFKFMSPGSCNDTNCQFMHLTGDMVAEFKRSKEVLHKLHEKKP